MPLAVHTFCAPRSRAPKEKYGDEPWSQAEWGASCLIKAIKGKTFSATSRVPVNGRLEPISDRDDAKAIGWFARWADRTLAREWGHPSPTYLVPVPNSKIVTGGKRGRTSRIASAIVNASKRYELADVLSWKRPMPSAHEQGGTRDPQELFDALDVDVIKLWELPNNALLVLVDDAWTTSGHLLAASAALRHWGYPVRLAVCAAKMTRRSLSASASDVWNVPPAFLNNFYPEVEDEPGAFDLELEEDITVLAKRFGLLAKCGSCSRTIIDAYALAGELAEERGEDFDDVYQQVMADVDDANMTVGANDETWCCACDQAWAQFG